MREGRQGLIAFLVILFGVGLVIGIGAIFLPNALVILSSSGFAGICLLGSLLLTMLAGLILLRKRR